MGIETSRWNAADHLDGKDAILAYLEAVFEDGDPALIAAALGDVARAQGLTADPALTTDPDIGAVVRTLRTLGLALTAKAA